MIHASPLLAATTTTIIFYKALLLVGRGYLVALSFTQTKEKCIPKSSKYNKNTLT